MTRDLNEAKMELNWPGLFQTKCLSGKPFRSIFGRDTLEFADKNVYKQKQVEEVNKTRELFNCASVQFRSRRNHFRVHWLRAGLEGAQPKNCVRGKRKTKFTVNFTVHCWAVHT